MRGKLKSFVKHIYYNKLNGNKRLIIHIMQPHYPFIEEHTRVIIGDHDGILSLMVLMNESGDAHGKEMIWNMLRAGRINVETLWSAFEDNQRIVLEHIVKLLEINDGKTVVTSDHRNLFGEWLFPFPIFEYGHPTNTVYPILVVVSWLIVEKGDRRNEFMEVKGTIDDQRYDMESITDKLAALGY